MTDKRDFNIIFDKISKNNEIDNIQDTKLSESEIIELDEINELRKIVQNISDNQDQSFSTTH
ncbi:MAG: hypothetical protein JW871_02550 [Endomicrobiales bacterium]|nr:hypothetical protein [Endomicrobiales bacterium]